MRRTTPLPSLPLLLLAATVLLGVLAMHAVSGGPHSPRAAEHTMASSASAGPATGVEVGGAAASSAVGRAVKSLPGAFRDLIHPAMPADQVAPERPEHSGAATAAVCVAMLLGALVALGAGLPRRVRSDRPEQPGPLRVALRGELTRAPPPDLLTRLCVLRT